MTEGSQDVFSTLMTADLSGGMSRQDKLELIAALRRENNRMQAENHVLRRQLYLHKENAGLKVASVVSLLLTWLDEHQRGVKPSQYSTGTAGVQGNQDDLDGTITGLLQSMKENMDASNGNGQNEQANQGTPRTPQGQGQLDLDGTITCFLQSLKQTLGGVSSGASKDIQGSNSSGYGSSPPDSYERILPAGIVANIQSPATRPAQKQDLPIPTPTRPISLANPTPQLNCPHGYTLECVSGNAFSRQDDPSHGDAETSGGQASVYNPQQFQPDLAHGYTWIKQADQPTAAPRIEAPLAASTPTMNDARFGHPAATSTPAQLRPIKIDFSNVTDFDSDNFNYDSQLVESPPNQGFSQRVSQSQTPNLSTLFGQRNGQTPVVLVNNSQQKRPPSPRIQTPVEQTNYSQQVIRPPTPNQESPTGQATYGHNVTLPTTPRTPEGPPSIQTPVGQASYSQQIARPATPNQLTPGRNQTVRPLSPGYQTTPVGQTCNCQQISRPTTPIQMTPDPTQIARPVTPRNQMLPSNGSQDAASWQSTPAQPGVASHDGASIFSPQQMAHSPAVASNSVSAPASQADSALSEASVKYWQDLVSNPRVRMRLIGEVAYQLDRRILSYVFGGFDAAKRKKRFYGYIIKNIPEMISWEATDPNTGAVDQKRQSVLEHRRRYIIHSLGPLGYCVDRHADFAARMVNKYGLLPVTPEQTKAMQNGADKNYIGAVLRTITPDVELRDILILLDCLTLLAQDDGRSLFVW